MPCGVPMTAGSDETLRVWQIYPEESTHEPAGAAASHELPPWEVGGGALHPSLADGRGTRTEEETWE